ncbi:MFS transporter [Methanothrix sp.]|uniref:MFS transporter n=1 Tax=Methanothrix sp. TaxID=90426 RepID=UPI003C78E391
MNDKRAVLLAACMSSFITPFLSSSVTVALPAINSDFSIPDQSLLGWIMTGYLLAAAIFIVPFGRVADIHGRRRVFLAGLLMVVVSSILCSISSGVYMLIASRMVEGLGSAMIFGTSIAILASVFPQQERGRVLGINVAAAYLGLSTGPLLGGIITSYAGWRFIYLGVAVYSLLALAIARWKIKEEWRCAQEGEFDATGSILYAAMLLALIYGLTIIPDRMGALLLLVALVVLIIFLRWENENTNPVLKVNLLRNNVVFLFSNLAALINYSATAAVAFLLSLYLQYMKGFGPEAAGLILVAQPVVQAILSPLAGRLSDRIEPRIVASAGMGLCVLGLALFSFLEPITPLERILFGLVLMGLGFALFASPNTNAIMSSVNPCDYGVASGMVSTMRLVGQSLSLGIAMLIFSIIMGHVQIGQESADMLMESIRLAFIFFAGLCLVGTVFSLARGSLRG